MNQDQDRLNRTQSIILQLNKSGLSYLTHQQFSEAFEYFKQSQKIVNNQLLIDPTNIRVNKLAGITYNNLACYYKKTNKPKISLIYLQRALEVEVNKVEDWSATASTHLNICAIYSYLKEHQPAANHAELAINMLGKIEEARKDQLPITHKFTDEELKSIANLNMLAHYNLAIQLQHLKRYQQAIQQFSKARQLAKKIGKKHTGIIMVCDQSITRLQQIMNQLKDRLIKLVTRKREEQQKGHYFFMRKNKRNTIVKTSSRQKQQHILSTSLAGKMRQLKVYQQRPPHIRTRSIIRLKTTPKNGQLMIQQNRKNRNSSSFSQI